MVLGNKPTSLLVELTKALNAILLTCVTANFEAGDEDKFYIMRARRASAAFHQKKMIKI